MREPTPTELKLLTELYAEQREMFRKEPTLAPKFIGIGASRPDPSLPPVELAAATVLAQTILNLDATIWKR